ncbi:hypothetical protein CCP3SC1AL1_2640009 [Gammaproteobacteria bacterium]
MSERRLLAAANMAVRQRNYRRARDRALVKLAQLYPDAYKELLEREKANDEAQGRKWLDINGTTTATDSSVSTGGIPADHSPDNNRTYKSNYGGEA